MIYDELNTAFRWYSDIDRQNRYKNQCLGACEYALLSTCDDLPPFQIRTLAIGTITAWNLVKIDGTASMDLFDCIEFLNVYTSPDGYKYISYNGGSITGCIGSQIPCGKWYATIADDDGTVLYSEIFEVVPITNAATAFPTLDPSLFTAWRFYDDIDKQTRYKSNCVTACNYYLTVNKNRLLPFMFRAASIGNIQSFRLIAVDGSCEIILSNLLIQSSTYLGYDYLFYNGDDIEDLECGTFYAVVTDETQTWYSELIKIVDMSAIEQDDYIMTDDGDILTTDDGIGITVD